MPQWRHGAGQNQTTLFSPLSLSSCVLWLDASQVTGFTSAAGMSSWADLSGVTGAAAQSSAGQQPVWHTNVTNSRSAVKFDGSDDTLKCTTSCFSSAMARSIWAVFSYIGTSDAGIAGQSSGIGAGTWFEMQSRVSLGSSGTPYLAGFAADLGGAAVSTAWCVGAITYDGTTATLRKNGAQVASSAKTYNTVDSLFRIGSDFTGGEIEFFNGHIGEVVVYRAVPSSADMERLESYLGAKWGVTISTA